MQVCNDNPVLPESVYLNPVAIKRMRGPELDFVEASSWDEVQCPVVHWECYLLIGLKNGIKMLSNLVRG